MNLQTAGKLHNSVKTLRALVIHFKGQDEFSARSQEQSEARGRFLNKMAQETGGETNFSAATIDATEAILAH